MNTSEPDRGEQSTQRLIADSRAAATNTPSRTGDWYVRARLLQRESATLIARADDKPRRRRRATTNI